MRKTAPEPCNPQSWAREKALKLLDVRSRSHSELKQRLVSSGFSEDLVNRVLEYLSELGLVDDHRFALERAKAMGKGKGWGPRKISYDLRNRGISEQTIDVAISQAYEPLGHDEVMHRLVRKRLGDLVHAIQSDFKLRDKMQRYLIDRGFDPEEVWAFLSRD